MGQIGTPQRTGGTGKATASAAPTRGATGGAGVAMARATVAARVATQALEGPPSWWEPERPSEGTLVSLQKDTARGVR